MTATGFFNISASEYHADCANEPSLSSTLAKTLLNETPLHAWLKHPKLNPNYETQDESKFDLGSVTHELILGKGGGFELLDFADYRTKAAQEARKAAQESGKTPILTEQFERAEGMAASVLGRLREVKGLEQALMPGIGMTETVLVWKDAGGPICRAMLDYYGPDETTIIDIKTTSAGLSNSAIMRQIVNYSYDLSAGFYLRGMRALKPELEGKMRWLWVFVEADAPHELRVIQADATTLTIGDRKAALAIELWRQCLESGNWPGYPATIDTIEYPAFAENQWIERELNDPAAMTATFSGRVIENKPKELIYGV